MSAVILAFPRQAPPRPLCDDLGALSPFSAAWCDQHLPLIEAAVDLLAAEDGEFAQRCALMRDEGGRAILDEPAGQLSRLGSHIADVADALEVTAARIRDQMTAKSGCLS